MRVEPYAVNSIVHVVKRGGRGLPITRDENDQKRFVKLLYYLNDEHRSVDWAQDISELQLFERPVSWPERRPLTSILAWTLMPNHFHLLLQETKEGGIARSMQSICGSMSRHFNEKYQEKGSLFQSAYTSRTVDSDEYLRYVAAYIMVKNVFELYPAGLSKASTEFSKAWKWAIQEYPFSSLRAYALGETSPILTKDVLGEIFESDDHFKLCAQDVILGRLDHLKDRFSFE